MGGQRRKRKTKMKKRGRKKKKVKKRRLNGASKSCHQKSYHQKHVARIFAIHGVWESFAFQLSLEAESPCCYRLQFNTVNWLCSADVGHALTHSSFLSLRM